MLSDQENLERWCGGDRAAGALLVQRHYTSVFRFFRAKAGRDADDLVQQTFLALVEGVGRFRGEASFRSYLFGTARNVLLHHWRRRRRKEDRIDFGTQSVVDLDASPSAVLAEKGERRLLLEGLRRIPVDDQIVIELFHWEGLTGPEVGEVLGITEPAVRSRLHRARARLVEAAKQIAGAEGTLGTTTTDLDAWADRVHALLDAPVARA